MEEQEKIEIKKAETEINVCFESLSKTKYQLLYAREELKNAQLDLKMLEGKMKFMREIEIPAIQSKIKNMAGHVLGLENSLSGGVAGGLGTANNESDAIICADCVYTACLLREFGLEFNLGCYEGKRK